MKPYKATVLTFAEKCKNILASNWQGYLNTIKTDAKGSKDDIYTSKVKYIIKRGKPYIWVPENDLHNVGRICDAAYRAVRALGYPGTFSQYSTSKEDSIVFVDETGYANERDSSTIKHITIDSVKTQLKNAIIDERGSFAVTTPFPGPLGGLLKSVKKLPTRVALAGDVVLLEEDKAKSLAEKVEQVILSEQKTINEFSYYVSGVLSSSLSCTSRSDNLKVLLGAERYSVYKFEMRSCTYIDGYGGNFEVDVEDMETSKADLLAPFSAKLIDGINQSDARRRALMLFCFVYMNANAKDAYITSIDRKGFDVLGKVPGPVLKDGMGQYQWKEFRFMFKEEANNVETFCRQLVEMEEEAIKKVSSYSGLR